MSPSGGLIGPLQSGFFEEKFFIFEIVDQWSNFRIFESST